MEWTPAGPRRAPDGRRETGADRRNRDVGVSLVPLVSGLDPPSGTRGMRQLRVPSGPREATGGNTPVRGQLWGRELVRLVCLETARVPTRPSDALPDLRLRKVGAAVANQLMQKARRSVDFIVQSKSLHS